ncbi:MAG: YggU family protein [Proteobacteria bacterium]|nr:YggU family protein [Pseudomonadota bacterium]
MTIIALHVIPGASRDEVVGWVEAPGGLALKIKLRAPAQDGKANEALIDFLRKEWKLGKGALELASGERSRHKRLRLQDADFAAGLAARYPR